MHMTSLRKVGGSVMLAVPRALLDVLHLAPGAMVGLVVDNGRLMVDPAPKRRYSLEDLLAASDYNHPPLADQQGWIDAPAVGREIL